MQDGIHTSLKLRNRMLRFYNEMPMGNKQVSAAHLKVKHTYSLLSNFLIMKIIQFSIP